MDQKNWLELILSDECSNPLGCFNYIIHEENGIKYGLVNQVSIINFQDSLQENKKPVVKNLREESSQKGINLFILDVSSLETEKGLNPEQVKLLLEKLRFIKLKNTSPDCPVYVYPMMTKEEIVESKNQLIDIFRKYKK